SSLETRSSIASGGGSTCRRRIRSSWYVRGKSSRGNGVASRARGEVNSWFGGAGVRRQFGEERRLILASARLHERERLHVHRANLISHSLLALLSKYDRALSVCRQRSGELDTRIKNAALMVTVSMLSIACSMKDGASQVQAPKAQIGSFGLDLTTGDPSVKPGDDFFVYANGKWLSTFEIPPDKSSYGAFVKLADDTEVQVREIIEAAAAMQAPAGSVEQKVGDYYASFMDEAAIEAAGLDPLKPGLGRILNARDKKEIAALFGAPGVKTLFGVGVVPDLKQPDRYSLVVVQSGLGLPNRDYYLKDDEKLKDVREKYVAYIEQMLRLGEIEAPAKKAKAIMALETALAEVHWPIERTRDAEANYNPHTKAELIAYAPGFDWQTFFDALEIPTRERFVVRQT